MVRNRYFPLLLAMVVSITNTAIIAANGAKLPKLLFSAQFDIDSA
jgi:hypothetical protein